MCEILARGGSEETEEEGSVVVFLVVDFDAGTEVGEVEAVVVEGVVSVTGGAGVALSSSEAIPSSSSTSRKGRDFNSARPGGTVVVNSFSEAACTGDVEEVEGFCTSPLTAFSFITIPTLGFLYNTLEGIFFLVRENEDDFLCSCETFLCSCDVFLCSLSDFIFLVSS